MPVHARRCAPLFAGLLRLALCTALMSLPGAGPAHAQQITREQLQALAPQAQDLPDFVRTQPADEIPPAGPIHFPARPLEDWVRLNFDFAEYTKQRTGSVRRTGIVSTLARSFYSSDDMFRLSMSVSLCDCVKTAHEELRSPIGNAQVSPGTFGGRPVIGDESLYHSYSSSNTLGIRLGKAVIYVTGQLSNVASRSGVQAEFPASAVEAVANLILLRLAKQPDLTGVPNERLTVTVNGKPLAESPVAVGGRVFLRVVATAQAAGRECRWDAKTGTLTLRRASGETVTLPVGVSLAAVNAARKGQQPAFVLLEDGQQVMEVEDLLRVLGGKVVRREGGTLAITL